MPGIPRKVEKILKMERLKDKRLRRQHEFYCRRNDKDFENELDLFERELRSSKLPNYILEIYYIIEH